MIATDFTHRDAKLRSLIQLRVSKYAYVVSDLKAATGIAKPTKPDRQLAVIRAGQLRRSARAAPNISVSLGQTSGQIRRGYVPCRI
jgi:hypothetical protein